MGYFDRVNPGLFSLFSGENKNLYYDAIAVIDKHCESNHIYKRRAKNLIVTMMAENEDYKYDSGKELTLKELEDKAGTVLFQLKSHGWINEYKEMLDEDQIYITKNANILFKAMKEMAFQDNKFEFKNAVQRVYNVCKNYVENEYSPLEYYIGFLKEAYENTEELKKQMIRFNHEFEDMVKELSKEMTIKELSDYVLDVFNGNRMMNYSRILNDESGYFRYSAYIVKVIKDVKYNKMDELIDSYKKNVPIEEQVYDPDDHIWTLLSRVQDFYEDEYTRLANTMAETVAMYLRRINNKMKMTFTNAVNTDDPSDMFLSLVGKNIAMDDSKYIDERLNNLINLWKIKIVDKESLTRNNQKPEEEDVVITETEIDDETIEETRMSALEEMTKANERNADNTKRYMLDHFGSQKQVYVSELVIDTVDDYIRMHDIINHSMSDDFEYEIEILENEERIKNGKVTCTPFIIKRKEI